MWSPTQLSVAHVTWVSASKLLSSKGVCSYVERKVCVWFGCVCDPNAPTLQVWSPLQILFLLHPSTFWLFSPSTSIVSLIPLLYDG